MYVIKTSGKKGILFLVDRTKTEKYWWTYNLNLVMKFNSLIEADKVATNLKYNDATVITLDEAYKIRNKIETGHDKRKIESELDNIESEYPEGWDGHKDTF